MTVTFQGTSKSADAPDIDEGTYPAEFVGVNPEQHDEWKGESKKYPGKFDSGARFRWFFTVYDEGDALRFDLLTNTNLNLKSKTVPQAIVVLKAIMTPAQFRSFEGGEQIDGAAIVGNACQVTIEENDKGWPNIVAVLPPAKAAGKAK